VGWRPALLAAAVLLLPVLASGAPEARPKVPVAVYVNVDEMSALWPFRNPETGVFPKPGEAGYDAYRAVWEAVIGETLKEVRRRVPKEFVLLPARSSDQPYVIKIDLWIADLATSCGAPTYYKYLWVRTRQRGDGYATNWDGLGVRSDTLVDVAMPPPAFRSANGDAWVELWAQVPYLHVTPVTEPTDERLEGAGA
jgi:hypothetical protein